MRLDFSSLCSCLALAATLFLSVVMGSPTAGFSQEPVSATQRDFEPPIRTDSPRATFETFLRLSQALEEAVLAYQKEATFAGLSRISLMSDQLVALIDLEPIPAASRRETGIRTFSYMMDILGRIGASDPNAFPDADSIEATDDAGFRVPDTPLRIVRIPQGAREGEYLFASSTVQAAPRFLAAVRHLPLRTRLETDSLVDFGKQLTGPLVPASWVRAVPAPLKQLWLDTPIWKVVTVLIVIASLSIGLAWILRILAGYTPTDRLSGLLVKTLMPAALIVVAAGVLPFISHQLNVSGRFADMVSATKTLVTSLGYAWLLWFGVRVFMEWIIRSPAIVDESLDANLLRLVAGTVGLVGAAIVLAFGGQAIGLPVLSVLAGLGIGGLAVALAVRPTLENLVGGVMLYVDRPVRVGDFCSFGDQTGTVEGIGIRSTKLRALDRTLITVPNAQFADMQIVNWAQCDQMLINETIGVRYETRPDQLRFLLAQMRRMFHAHPRIDPDTVRVRFSGYGQSALNINIRVYASTREWNEFFAIREDVLLRVFDIVEEAGTSFAFNSRTLYLARDQGLDQERSETAREAVEQWRSTGRLPFPKLTREEIQQLQGKLDYPPRGSAEATGGELGEHAAAEPLSTPSSQTAPTGSVPSNGDDFDRRS